MNKLYYFFCNHATEGGIGFAYPKGWYNGKKYASCFYSIYSINKMLDAVDQYPGLKVSMELDAYAYEAVAAVAPECITRLKKYLATGCCGIDGGTYSQPFGQDYGWESNIRQLTLGRKAIFETTGADVRAFLVEEQWFHPQLPQLLQQSGFKYASLQCQNSGQVKPLNKEMIIWRGIDGSLVPTLPANNLLASCVRQYTDYKDYRNILDSYANPLLFQWVEIWTPGMDWGASCTPFDKAINHVFEMNGECVATLSEYFEKVLPLSAPDEVYIPIDQSNYANNWYQGGGWGYDGDKVIIEDVKNEQAMLAYQYSAMLHNNSTVNSDLITATDIDNYWKRIMVLQNHDVSVARSYRAVRGDIITDAGCLTISDYKAINSELSSQMHKHWHFSAATKPASALLNYSQAHGKTTITLPEKQRAFAQAVCEEFGETVYLTTAELQPLTATTLSIPATAPVSAVHSEATRVETSRYVAAWQPGSWSVRLTDKLTGQSFIWTAFSGSVGKMNEHDSVFYPALSPGHETFTFAFDGATHSPDQCSGWRVSAHSEQLAGFEATLVLRVDLLTLHTTTTAVTFAEARIKLREVDNDIEFANYIYSSVPISINACAVLTANSERPLSYYRDFPFGEEQTSVHDSYANSYIRATDGVNGFALVNFGTQRLFLDNNANSIKHLISRTKLFGEYTWRFRMSTNHRNAAETARYSKAARANFPIVSSTVPLESFVTISNTNLVVGSIHPADELAYEVRLVNYSADATTLTVESQSTLVNLCGELLQQLQPGDSLPLRAWELVTLRSRYGQRTIIN